MDFCKHWLDRNFSENYYPRNHLICRSSFPNSSQWEGAGQGPAIVTFRETPHRCRPGPLLLGNKIPVCHFNGRSKNMNIIVSVKTNNVRFSFPPNLFLPICWEPLKNESYPETITRRWLRTPKKLLWEKNINFNYLLINNFYYIFCSRFNIREQLYCLLDVI